MNDIIHLIQIGKINFNIIQEACIFSISKNLKDKYLLNFYIEEGTVIPIKYKNFFRDLNFNLVIMDSDKVKMLKNKKLDNRCCSDIIRLDVLIKHGGLYLDNDVFVLKDPIKEIASLFKEKERFTAMPIYNLQKNKKLFNFIIYENSTQNPELIKYRDYLIENHSFTEPCKFSTITIKSNSNFVKLNQENFGTTRNDAEILNLISTSKKFSLPNSYCWHFWNNMNSYHYENFSIEHLEKSDLKIFEIIRSVLSIEDVEYIRRTLYAH